MDILTYSQLNDREKELVDSAQEALKLSYNPYNSGKLIGAAIRTMNGRLILGGNFANNSSRSNICAERAVIVTANNLKHRDIEELAIIGLCETNPFEEPVTPCGECRQVLSEIPRITGKELIIYCSNQDKSKILRTSISELLPHGYE